MYVDTVKILPPKYLQDLPRYHPRIHHPVIHCPLLCMVADDPLSRSAVHFFRISIGRRKYRDLVPELDQFVRLALHRDWDAPYKWSVIVSQHCYLHV